MTDCETGLYLDFSFGLGNGKQFHITEGREILTLSHQKHKRIMYQPKVDVDKLNAVKVVVS